MAKLYGEILSSALMTFDKSFARANGQPLDSTEVYYSLAAAEEYAAGAGAYVGQKIVVIENDVVTHYSIEDAAGTLKELGSKPVGDNHSIEVAEDGTVSLKDFGTGYYKYIPAEKNEDGSVKEGTGCYESTLTEGFAENLTLKVRAVAAGEYEIAWYAPNTDTTEGVLDTVTGLTESVETLNQNVDEVEQDIVDLNEALYGEGGTPEAPAEGSIADNVNDLLDTVGDEDDILDENVTTLWAYVNDHTERIETIETDYVKTADLPVVGVAADDKVLSLTADKLVAATVSLGYDEENKAIKLYGKDSVELGSVSATPFIKDGMLKDVEYSEENNTLTFTWNTDGEDKVDTVVLSDIIEPYTAGVGLELVGNEFKAKLADGSENFLTITADGIKLAGVADAIATAKQEAIDAAADAAAGIYATQEDMEALELDIDGRLDALEAYDHTTYATKAELKAHEDAAVAAYATKTELKATDDKAVSNATAIENLTVRIDDIVAEGGEPNQINNIKVNGVVQPIAEDKSVNITVPVKFSDLTDDSGFTALIEAAQTQANKGVDEAGKANAAAAAAQADVDALEPVVGKHTTTLASHTTTIADHTDRIVKLEQADATHAAEFKSLSDIVSGHTTTIAGKADQTALDAANTEIGKNTAAIKTINETTIPAVNEAIGLKANAADVYTKTEIGAIEEGKTIVKMIEEAKSEATYDDAEVRGLISDNAAAIENIYKAGVDGAAATGVLATEIARVEGLVGTEKERAEGIEADFEERIAKMETFWAVADDPVGTIDKLEEIVSYISDDKTGALDMAADIQENKEAIADIYTPADGETPASGLLVDVEAKADANAAAIEEINDTANGILAQAKKYTDDEIAAIFEDNKASDSAFGVVKGDAKGVHIEAGEIKTISVDLLVNGENELILNGGSAI